MPGPPRNGGRRHHTDGYGIATLQRRVLADSTTHESAAPDPEPRLHDDRELATRAARGDMVAFEALYRRHSGRVHAICLRLTADRLRAEEAVQDVFVRLWERLASFRGESAFGSWLHRLAINTVLQTIRGTRRREARVATSDDGELEGAVNELPVDERIDLEDAIARLPQQVRMVVVLHDIEGFTHEEIATMTGVPPGTVRSQLSRARKTLLQWLTR